MSACEALNILLVGGESAGLQTLRLLIQSPHQVAGVLTSPETSARDSGLWNTARKNGIECLPAESVRLPEFAAEICERNVDVLLNVHSLYLIPAEVLEACRIGAFNLHPGPLPEYAGLDVPGWAIYHGETTHGVTLHSMVPQVDAGQIAYQSRFDIGPNDTGLTLMSRCVRQGIPLVETLLEDLYRDPASVPRIPQDLSKRRCFSRRPPNGGWLDWNRSAQQVVNQIRAADYSPFPSPWGHPVSLCDRESIGFVRATATVVSTGRPPGTVGSPTDRGVLVAAADSWVDVECIEHNGTRQKASEGLIRDTILRGCPDQSEERPDSCRQFSKLALSPQ